VLGSWRWTVTGNYARTANQTRTARNADFTALRAGVLAGTVSPFAPDFGANLLFLAPDLASSLNQNMDVRSTLAGTALKLPAGDVQMTFASGFTRQMLDSETWRSSVTNDVALRRNIMNHSVNAELPLTNRDFGLGSVIGEWVQRPIRLWPIVRLWRWPAVGPCPQLDLSGVHYWRRKRARNWPTRQPDFGYTQCCHL
jgi:hypothetical protein